MSPLAPSKSCLTPRCSGVGSYRGRCARCAAQREQQRANVDVRRWYRTARWKDLRAIVLREEPNCCDCAAIGKTEPSTDVDHQRPHRGSAYLFWDRANLRGRCHACHARKTQRGE